MNLEGVRTVEPGIQNYLAQGLKRKDGPSSFGTLFAEKLQEKEEIRISRHASERMEERGVVMSEQLKGDLAAAMDTAEKKGARNALVIGGQDFFIVNIPNRTIVTAVTREEMKEHIFTNIDSAVLI